MHIQRVKIENFRCIERFEEEFSRYSNIFCGVNGSGKTTILQALEILFSWFIARFNNIKGNGTALKDDDIKYGADYCLLEVTLDDNTTWSLYRQHSRVRKPNPQKSNLKGLTERVNYIVEKANKEEHYPTPVFTSFPVYRRAVATLPKRIHKKHALGKFDVYNSNADSKVNPHAFFVWFREREDIENELYRYGKEGYKDSQLEAVRQATSQMISGYKNLRIERPRGFVIEKNEEKFAFDQLSDGEKSYIILTADIARLLAMANPSPDENPLLASGIILIDEIDLHLHPKWQREVLPQLRKVFPNCQFFITTHSPFVLSSADASNTIFVTEQPYIRLVEDRIYGAEVSHILLDTLGLSSLRDRYVEQDIQEIWKLLNSGISKGEELKMLIGRLKEKLNPNDPEFVKISLQKRWLESNKEG
ncbi:AAA family ATPase [Porphyromonas gingivalis]|uniref:AAA family ATPase n=1 Tax=Porphyromonas gingivalis TaxID=837 RepID=UPI000BE75159|nr:AAA family ATPase [Porphyromonas gingivalis]ATR93035.1 chromosome segregation protein SMC [Porphyromonas gingivalis]ATS08038.1 chromosome segregation protein SMC [Porphyromonas gingivalis]PDP80166.1 chromosome segregation protein SMC [Porphyromonas gingivalis]